MATKRRSWRVLATATLLAAGLVAAPPAGAVPTEPGVYGRDVVDPPAPGEGTPLANPADPAPSALDALAQPSANVRLSGPRWRSLRAGKLRAVDGLRLSRDVALQGWRPRTTSAAVVVAEHRPFDAVAAAGLAGAVDGPVLLTRRRSLSESARSPIRRLGLRRVFVVGPLPRNVARAVRRAGAEPVRVGVSRNRYKVAGAVAKHTVAALERRRAPRRTLVVASGESVTHSAAAAALAAGRAAPVLLAPRSGGSPGLRRRARALGARRSVVVGGQGVIGRRATSGLRGVRRLGGRTAAATYARVAGYAHRGGQRGAPVVVQAGNWKPAVLGGVLAGVQRRAPVLLAGARGLPPGTAAWLDAHTPSKALAVGFRRPLSPMAACQLESGGLRRWRCAEQELRRQGYNIKHADGHVDRYSPWAIYAFRKVAGMTTSTTFDNRAFDRLLRRPVYKVRRPDLPADHLEINLAKQLIVLVRGGKARHIVHTSSGKPSTPTVRGTFSVYEKRDYYQPWNGIYRGIFFYGGYAIHGYASVPTYPASHGCARTFYGNQDWVWPKISYGERVAVY